MVTVKLDAESHNTSRDTQPAFRTVYYRGMWWTTRRSMQTIWLGPESKYDENGQAFRAQYGSRYTRVSRKRYGTSEDHTFHTSTQRYSDVAPEDIPTPDVIEYRGTTYHPAPF